MFARGDARWLAESARAIHAARTTGELVQAAVDALDSRWGLVATACEEFNLSASYYVGHDLRVRGPLAADHAAYVHDNPILTALQAGRCPAVGHLRGLVTAREWERTDHFNGIARVTGFADQLAIFIPGNSTFVTFSLFSATTFSERDRILASLARSHLQAAWSKVGMPPPTGTRSS